MENEKISNEIEENNDAEIVDNEVELQLEKVVEPEGEAIANGFVKSVFKFSIAPIVNFVLGIVSIILLSRLFAPEQYGLINLFTSVSAVILGLSCFGLDSGVLRFYNEPPKGMTGKDVLFKSFALSFIFALVISLIGIIFHNQISSLIFKKASLIIYLALIVNLIGGMVSRYFIIFYRIGNFAKKYTWLSIFTNVSYRIVLIIVAFIMPSDGLILLLMAASTFVLSAIYFIVDFKKFLPEKPSLSLKHFSPVVKYSLPLWPVTILNLLNPFLTNMILTNKLGLNAAGMFASANFFVSIISVFQAGFAVYWATYMYANYKTQQKTIKQTQTYVLFFTLFICCGIMVFKDVLYMFIGDAFQGSKQYFSFNLMVQYFYLVSETSSYGVTIAKKTYLSIISTSASVVVNFIICFFLVDIIGVAGASVATAAASIIYFILQFIFSQKYYNSVGSKSKTLYACIVLSIIPIINYFVINIWIFQIIIWAIIILTIIVFMKQIKQILGFIFKKRKKVTNVKK